MKSPNEITPNEIVRQHPSPEDARNLTYQELYSYYTARWVNWYGTTYNKKPLAVEGQEEFPFKTEVASCYLCGVSDGKCLMLVGSGDWMCNACYDKTLAVTS